MLQFMRFSYLRLKEKYQRLISNGLRASFCLIFTNKAQTVLDFETKT